MERCDEAAVGIRARRHPFTALRTGPGRLDIELRHAPAAYLVRASAQKHPWLTLGQVVFFQADGAFKVFGHGFYDDETSKPKGRHKKGTAPLRLTVKGGCCGGERTWGL